MLWKIELAPSTLADLKGIEAYHQERDADYAQNLIRKLFGRFDSLSQLPHRGTLPPFEELRDYLQVLEKPYRILYRLDHQTQDVLSAWQSRERS